MVKFLYLLFYQILPSHAGYITPEQVHLSWTDTPNEIKVTWVTFLPISSSIYYRKVFCSYTSDWDQKDSESYVYDAGKYIFRLEYIHTSNIIVDKDCNYEYYVGSFLGWSAVYKFNGRTHGPNDFQPTNLIIVADWGGGAQAVYTKNLMLREVKFEMVDAILHAGDIAYELGDLDGMVGDAWFNMIQPIAARVPYMTLPGNHETERNYSQYINKYKMPKTEGNGNSGLFYSFNLGWAHYVMFNTEFFFGSDATSEAKTEINWLKNDLEEANKNRNEVPWIIILTHRPLYCSIDWTSVEQGESSDCAGHSYKLRGILEDIIFEAGVDLFIQAHVHNYERTSPVYKNTTISSEQDGENFHVNPNAPIYITDGSAGSKYGHNDPAPERPAEWSRHVIDEFGYGRLCVSNGTHLYYEQFSSISFQVVDFVWIIKDKLRY